MSETTEKLLAKTEVVLASGRPVTVTCPIDMAEEVVKALASVSKLELPVAARTTIWHGNSPVYSRYDIEQILYREYIWGYVEILKVNDNPESRSPIILHERFRGGGRTFSYWKTLTNAQYTADQSCWPTNGTNESFKKLAGFLGLVRSDGLIPWFLAVGDEQLIGEYVFPKRHFQHPVFRPGQDFLVYDMTNPKHPRPKVKRCVCCKMEKVQTPQAPLFTEEQLVIYWSDGSRTTEYSMRGNQPIPLEEGDMWLVEAKNGLDRLLANPNDQVSIRFTDHTVFGVKIRRAKNPSLRREGLYGLTANVKGGELIHWQKHFCPTERQPSILEYAIEKMEKGGHKIIWIQVREFTPVGGQKELLGDVFYSPTA